jgi:hypothetical protein
LEPLPRNQTSSAKAVLGAFRTVLTADTEKERIKDSVEEMNEAYNRFMVSPIDRSMATSKADMPIGGTTDTYSKGSRGTPERPNPYSSDDSRPSNRICRGSCPDSGGAQRAIRNEREAFRSRYIS